MNSRHCTEARLVHVRALLWGHFDSYKYVVTCWLLH